MQSNTGILESSLRVLLTVNSTSATAFSTITDLAGKTAWGEAEQNAAMAVDTVAASRGRIIDIGRSRSTPYQAASVKSGRILGGSVGEGSQASLSLPTRLVLYPLGFHSSPDGKTFAFQVHGLYPVYTSDTGACGLWEFRPIVAATATLGAVQVGSASIGGSALYYAKDIAVGANAANPSTGVTLLDASDFAAYPGAGGLVVGTNGARWLYIRGTLDGGTATSWNMGWGTN